MLNEMNCGLGFSIHDIPRIHWDDCPLESYQSNFRWGKDLKLYQIILLSICF